ncbi:MAG: DEAD/DEAH box helicase, partial [Flavobacterium sp.]
MKPEVGSINLLSITRSRAKMYEYDVPRESFINLPKDPKELLMLTIGILGDFSASSSEDSRNESRLNMLFAAQYFDAYISSRLNQTLDNYLLLLGSAAYYLCDLPGSSFVLINNLDYTSGDIGSEDLEYLLISVLRKDFDNMPTLDGNYKSEIERINTACKEFLLNGTSQNEITKLIDVLRDGIYYEGSDRQLLLIDTIRNVIIKFFSNSSWSNLPIYSGIDSSQWEEIIKKPSFIKELWPAQILLGEKNVYNGMSAIIQMPTSAGKTKSIEIIIRSSFLSSRANVAVIVAPFKALCNEIKGTLQEAFVNERVRIDVPSDAFQIDFDIFSEIELETEKLILILTPEKFIYMMRHAPEIIDEVGLLVYDEGHQFDNGIRGVTYELLLSSLRLLIPKSTQIILISAVIMNADSIGNWLIGDNKTLVNGANLLPTYRTIGFVSWRDNLGRLEFVNPEIPDIDEFYVPRVISTVSLAKLGRERNARIFPIKKDGKSIAIFLGLK